MQNRTDFIYPTFPIKMVKDRIEWKLSKSQLRRYVNIEIKEAKSDPIWRWAATNFKHPENDEQPWELSPGQLAFFKLIYGRQHRESQINSSTQYGKSLTLARAILARIRSFAEDWTLVVPDTKRGKIVLNYMIKAVSQNKKFRMQLVGLDVGKKDVLNRLLEERTKLKLTFQLIINGEKKYSSVSIVSADSRRTNPEKIIDAIMGFGGKNIVFEEASLTDDAVEAGVYRMIAGKGADYFYLKIGNPFRRNHFLTSWRDTEVMKIFVDDRLGLAEGRYQPDVIKKAKTKPKANVLYRTMFPTESEIDSDGWQQLISEDELRNALVKAGTHLYTNYLGCDVKGTGSDWNCAVRRSHLFAEVVLYDQANDTAGFAGRILVKRDKIKKDTNEELITTIDAVGVGKGCADTVKEKASDVYHAVGGAKPENSDRFFNQRAELYWRLRKWILAGGKLIGSYDDWVEILVIKYKITSGKKIQIISKELLFKSGIPSPNKADSLSYTFLIDEEEAEAESSARIAANRENNRRDTVIQR